MGIVGESGSGRSTLLRLISCDSGSLAFDGTETATLDGKALRNQWRRVRPVFQDPYSTFNPRFPIGLGFELPGDRRRFAIREDVRWLLGNAGLDLDRVLPPQHPAIACTLAVRPDLLLLDVSVPAQVLNLFKDLPKRYAFTRKLDSSIPVVPLPESPGQPTGRL